MTETPESPSVAREAALLAEALRGWTAVLAPTAPTHDQGSSRRPRGGQGARRVGADDPAENGRPRPHPAGRDPDRPGPGVRVPDTAANPVTGRATDSARGCASDSTSHDAPDGADRAADPDVDRPDPGWDPPPASDWSRPESPHHAGCPGPAVTASARGCASCGCPAPVVCTACPVCRAAGVLNVIRPDTLNRLADLAMTVAELLRAAAEGARGPAAAPPPRRPGGPTDRPAGASGRARVQDIPLGLQPPSNASRPGGAGGES